MWSSSRTCSMKPAFSDPNTCVKYVRNHLSWVEIIVTLLDVSIHALVSAVAIPITAYLHSPLLSLSFSTVTSAQDCCLTNLLKFVISSFEVVSKCLKYVSPYVSVCVFHGHLFPLNSAPHSSSMLPTWMFTSLSSLQSLHTSLLDRSTRPLATLALTHYFKWMWASQRTFMQNLSEQQAYYSARETSFLLLYCLSHVHSF